MDLSGEAALQAAGQAARIGMTLPCGRGSVPVIEEGEERLLTRAALNRVGTVEVW